MNTQLTYTKKQAALSDLRIFSNMGVNGGKPLALLAITNGERIEYAIESLAKVHSWDMQTVMHIGINGHIFNAEDKS